jgi:hypothetical protein
MFSFFHRSSVLNIDCFTSNQSAIKTTPIVPSYKARPEWMDDVPKTKHQYSYDNNGNIFNDTFRSVRSCIGFLDLYKRGFILEAWADLCVDAKDGRFTYHWTNGPAPACPPGSMYNPGFINYDMIKFSSPWLIQTKERIPFITFGTEWSLEHIDARLIPGSITFADVSYTNVFMAFKKTLPGEHYRITIPMGQPLMQFVPLTERKIKVHNHLISDAEMNQKSLAPSTSMYGWRKTFSLLRRNEKRQGKCPFS